MFFSIFWPLKFLFGILGFALNLVVLASCILTMMALMGDKGWVWSLTTHFRAQYLLVQLLALVWLSINFWFKSKRDSLPSRVEMWLTLVVLMFFAGLNLNAIAPYYWPQPEALSGAKHPGQTIKLMHLNLFGYANHNSDLAIQAIRAENPDILDLVEYTTPWQRNLERSGILKHYPYRVNTSHDHIGLYSKLPLRNTRVKYADPKQKTTNQANIFAQFTLNRQPVTILVAHPASPILPSHLEWQQESFKAWIKERKGLGQNLLIVGDLNTAPWSVEFAQLINGTGLRDSQLGFGFQPSWPVFLPVLKLPHTNNIFMLPFRIPIDHVLVSDRFAVLSRKTGPFIGSDHLPVIIELGLKPKREQAPGKASL